MLATAAALQSSPLQTTAAAATLTAHATYSPKLTPRLCGWPSLPAGADDMVYNAKYYTNLLTLVKNAAVWASGKSSGIRIAASTSGWTSGVVTDLVALVSWMCGKAAVRQKEVAFSTLPPTRCTSLPLRSANNLPQPLIA